MLLEHGASAACPCEGSSALHIVASLAALPHFRLLSVAAAQLLAMHLASAFSLCALLARSCTP